MLHGNRRGSALESATLLSTIPGFSRFLVMLRSRRRTAYGQHSCQLSFVHMKITGSSSTTYIRANDANNNTSSEPPTIRCLCRYEENHPGHHLPTLSRRTPAPPLVNRPAPATTKILSNTSNDTNTNLGQPLTSSIKKTTRSRIPLRQTRLSKSRT